MSSKDFDQNAQECAKAHGRAIDFLDFATTKGKPKGGGMHGTASKGADGFGQQSTLYHTQVAICEDLKATCGKCGSLVVDKCKDINTRVIRLDQAAMTTDEAASKYKDIADKTGSQPPGGAPGGSPGGATGGGASPQSTTQKPQAGGDPMSQMMSALGGMMNQKDPEKQAPNQELTTPKDCQSLPTLAGCPLPGEKKTEETAKKEDPESGYGAESTGAPTGENFNVASTPVGNPGYNGNGEDVKPAPPPTVTPIQNGGGGIPGQEGGAPASVGNPNQAGYTGPSKSQADVLHGTTSGGGGYSALNASLSGLTNGGGGGGFSGYGTASTGHEGMDLKQFLPGGAQDPNRKVAGAINPSAMQIQPQSVNIWNRISERIRSRCSQGLLRDCIP
ncbi:MAG: hypothetical protein AB7F86_13840 [Bdellovibrionales bacterium]